MTEGWQWGLLAHKPTGSCWAAGASQPQNPNRCCPCGGEPHPSCPGSLRDVQHSWGRAWWRKGTLCHTDRPSPWLSGVPHRQPPREQQFALQARRQDVSRLSRPRQLIVRVDERNRGTRSGTQRCPRDTKLCREPGDGLEPPTAASSSLLQGSSAKAALPPARALWDPKLTPQQQRAERPPS